LDSRYIENTLIDLCNDSEHIFLIGEHRIASIFEIRNQYDMTGDNYFQPGFTLLFTLGFLIYFILAIRLRELIDLCWPSKLGNAYIDTHSGKFDRLNSISKWYHLGDTADDLVVSLSMLSYNEQYALIKSLHLGMPSLRNVFPEENLVRASQHIAERQMQGVMTTLCVKTKEDVAMSQSRFL